MSLRHEYADNTLEIDLGAVAANYRAIQARVTSHARVASVVKADAYGVGVGPVAKILFREGCREFFVATVEEGLELRTVLPDAVIYILYGIQAGQEKAFTEHKLVPVLNDLYQITLWQQLAKAQGKTLPAIIHVDTGMCRLGLSTQQFETHWDDKALWEGIDITCVMSHLACSNEPEHYLNLRQLRYAKEIKTRIGNIPLSLANSCGVFLGDAFHFDMVRPGSSLYGVDPLPEGYRNPMQQVVSLKTRILQVRHLTRTETVGYGATFEAAAGSRIAVLALGYADGYMRSFSHKGYGYIGGHKVPVIGRVSMDLVMIDVTNVPEHAIHAGAEVEVIGKHNPVSAVAKQAGTIEYEILTSLGKRYKRVYKGI